MVQNARISVRSNSMLEKVVAMTGRSKVEIIECALETYLRQERMRLFNAAYENLREDKRAWADEIKERGELEGMLRDGLEEE